MYIFFSSTQPIAAAKNTLEADRIRGKIIKRR
jgi:hypothetical protein